MSIPDLFFLAITILLAPHATESQASGMAKFLALVALASVAVGWLK